jgi:hypothetical protein
MSPLLNSNSGRTLPIDPAVYASYLAAVKTGKRADFDALPMVVTHRW